MTGTATPALSHAAVKEQLEAVFMAERRRFLVALCGASEPGTVETRTGAVTVVPVGSELELREKVPRVSDTPTRTAFLVPAGLQIPLDLAGLFARSGHVLRIGRDSRLKAIFGALEVDPEVLRSPLADHLIEGRGTGRGTGTGAGMGGMLAGRRLTLDALWAAWLEAEWNVPTAGGVALDTLLGWAAMSNSGSAFAEVVRGEPDGPALHAGLLEHLTSRLGPAGPVVWLAWEKGAGEQALEISLVLDALEGCTVPEVKMWVRLVAKRELGAGSDEEAERVARDLGKSAEGALRLVEAKEGVKRTRALLHAADAYPQEREVRRAMTGSRLLPSAWQHRLDVLGKILLKGARKPGSGQVDAAVAALGDLERHVMFKDQESGPVLKRAEMAVRLLSWLTAAPHRTLPGSASPHGEVESLGRWYAEEGGYVDWARSWARGLDQDELGRGIQAVLNLADQERTELDQRFARALVHWFEAGRPASQVVPIDDAVRRIAVEFLKGNEARRLLVLLMDGMAWTQAVEVLHSLGDRASCWGPIAWHASKDGKIGDGRYPVVLAAAPTITEVSRSAFFAGKSLGPGSKLSAEQDPKRWAAHRALGKLFPEHEAPRLLLRGEGHTAHGSASREALNLVGDESQRAVAIVVNAIDASLRGDTQERHSWTVESIKPLAELLEKAREAGRTVLLASDHGHVPGDRLQSVPASPGGGARWRPWTEENETLAEYEIGLSHDSVWAPRGAHGIVMLTDDAHRYGGGTEAGVHGGATLAEMVAPCLLLGCEDPAAPGAEDDRDLTIRPALVPAWWHFDTTSPGDLEPEEPRTPHRPRKLKPDERQIEMLAVTVEVEAEEEPEQRPGQGFEESAVLRARTRDAAERKRVAQAVRFLKSRNGIASDDAFASAMGTLAYRVGGLISRLQEVLNLDGYQVLRYDRETHQVYLDRDKLMEQFEVAL